MTYLKPTPVDLEAIKTALDQCMANELPGLLREWAKVKTRQSRDQVFDQALLKLQEKVQRSLERVNKRRAGLPCPVYPAGLPVVERREDILTILEKHQVVILCGETGSGKTTQLPKLCLELGRGTKGKIGHTQPRRIAARSLSARIAEELKTVPGQQVGYKIRFQDRVSENTYIKVMTDGILLAETRSDPDLREYDTIIIDEAHERSLTIDFLLGYLRQLLPRRPDLKVIITSATIDPERFSRHFNNAPIFEVSGRSYPVEIRYRPVGSEENSEEREREQAIVDAVDELKRIGSGDILIFLPGERDIRETTEFLRKQVGSSYDVLPLYARLSSDQQNQIFKPHKKRRIVLATNVAETSLTVPGIHYVIDPGVARMSRYSYRTRVQRLPIEAVSQASANQRSGRCGRIAAGVCIRLYSEEDFDSRQAFTDPEIQRTDLAAVILQMLALSLGHIEDFPFIDPPDSRYVRDGYRLLAELGATDTENQLTQTGKALAHLPVHPRLGRMLLAANDYNCLAEVLIIAAALEVADPFERPLEFAAIADEKHAPFLDKTSDFMSYLKLWKVFQEQRKILSQNKLRKWCKENFIAYMRMRDWQDICRQLSGMMKANVDCRDAALSASYESIHRALLTGLLGQVAMLSEEKEYLAARNLKFRIFPGSSLKKATAKWVIAAELIETTRRYLRKVAQVQPEWIEAIGQPLLKHSYSEPHWHMHSARVMAFERVTLFGLPVVLRRKIHFGPLDKAVARSVFIRHALVQLEYRSREPFMQHNKSLLESLGALEAKSRRPDLLVQDNILYEYFNQLIPENIVSGATFEGWWKKQKSEDAQRLNLQREQIMLHEGAGISAQQYPDHIELHGVRLPLRYQFTPGQQADGVGVEVPAVALKQFTVEDFDWLVPGLLQEKVELLIKSLPKQWRRYFVPVPEFSRAFIASNTTHSETIISTLTKALEGNSSVTIPQSEWHPEKLPAYLSTYYYLMNSEGGCIAEGRNWLQLQDQYADHAKADFSAASTGSFIERQITRWDFGDLPETVSLTSAGVEIYGYPAVTLLAGELYLKLHENAVIANAAHREGVLKLFEWSLQRAYKDVRRGLHGMQKQCLQFSSLGQCDALRDDIMKAVLLAVFMKSESSVRTEAGFSQLLEAGRTQVSSSANEITQWSAAALEEYHALNRQLKKSLHPSMLRVAEDVRNQLNKLIYPGFVSNTPLHWLPHLARYLQAARLRLNKYSSKESQDRASSAIVDGFIQRYEKVTGMKENHPEFLEMRWWIEELRVSLFAQELKTSIKISAERLNKAWPKL
ncbi:MAG: ATP-dependent RNA helicase HrpA [Gammaproteobacteria bacterium]